LYVLSGELGVSQAFLAHWYIGGGYTDVSEVAVFFDCGKIYGPQWPKHVVSVIK